MMENQVKENEIDHESINLNHLMTLTFHCNKKVVQIQVFFSHKFLQIRCIAIDTTFKKTHSLFQATQQMLNNKPH